MSDLTAPEPTANLDPPEPTKSFIEGEFVPPPPAPKLVDPVRALPTKPAVPPIDMPSLVGLQPEGVATLAAVPADVPSPEATKPPLYKESWFQLVVVGGCVTIAGWLLYALMFGGKPEEKVAAASPEPTVTTAPKADFAPDPAFGVMASKVAMNDRQQAILDMQKRSRYRRQLKPSQTQQPQVQPIRPELKRRNYQSRKIQRQSPRQRKPLRQEIIRLPLSPATPIPERPSQSIVHQLQ